MATVDERHEAMVVNANIQALRAIAAYGVVIHHIIDSYNNYIGIGRTPVSIAMGATGVEVFFVISGYIMSKTTDHSGMTPYRFMQNRLLRIVPSYWLLTLLAAAAVSSGFMIFGLHGIDMERLFHSLLFLPELGETGQILKPILFVGWTLEFEMLFYVLFFLTMFIRSIPLRRTSIISLLIVFTIIGGYSSNTYIQYIFSELLLAFMLGIVIRIAEQRISLTNFAALGLAAISAVGLAAVDLLPDVTKTPAGHLIVIIAAACLVVSAIALERRGLTVGQGFLMRQGDASYAIYLVHPFILQLIGKLALTTGLVVSDIGLGATMVAMFIATGIGGTIFYRWIDVPLVGFLKRQLLGRKPAPVGLTAKRFANP